MAVAYNNMNTFSPFLRMINGQVNSSRFPDIQIDGAGSSNVFKKQVLR